MFRPDTIVYEDDYYTNYIRENYQRFLNRNLGAFIGYAVGQARKFGIKGTRYKELQDFKKKLYVWTDKRLERKLSEDWEGLRRMVKDYKYINMVFAPGPKTSKDRKEIEYLEVLGSKYRQDITCGEFYNHIDKMDGGFGHRTKTSATSGADWKSLSHACRVLLEVEELLDTGYITFPLREKDFVKTIKEGKLPLKHTMLFIDAKLDEVKAKLDKTTLPERSDEDFIRETWLSWVIQDDRF